MGCGYGSIGLPVELRLAGGRRHRNAGALATFDCVIANPPFSLKAWGR